MLWISRENKTRVKLFTAEIPRRQKIRTEDSKINLNSPCRMQQHLFWGQSQIQHATNKLSINKVKDSPLSYLLGSAADTASDAVAAATASDIPYSNG